MMESECDESSSTILTPKRLSMKGVCHQVVEIGKDRLSAAFKIVAQHNNDVGAVRADRPVPLTCKAYYYEVTIINEGEKGKIGIGFADGEFQLQRQPGWEPNSYGYHGDDGKKFYASGGGAEYGPKFGTNDVIGAGIHLEDQYIFYTKNGKYLDVAFNDVRGELYPTIGLHSKGEKVEINFGDKPFVFDIDGMLQEEHARLQNEIKESLVPPTLIDTIVRNYLYHYGYSLTLNSFEEFCVMDETYKATVRKQDEDEDIKELEFRKEMRQKILKGQIDEVLELLHTQYPEVLTMENISFRDVIFTLHCQKFVELVREDNVEGAVQFAQKELVPFRGLCEKYDKDLHAIIALIAYTKPEDPSLKYLFSKERRDYVADVVNAALLKLSSPKFRKLHDQEPITAMEKLLKHLVSTHRQWHKENKNQGEIFRLQDHLFE